MIFRLKYQKKYDMAGDLSSLGHAFVGLVVVESMPGKLVILAVTICDHQLHWIFETTSLHIILEWLSVSVALLRQPDGDDVAALRCRLVESVSLAILRELRGGMEEILECDLIGLLEVLLLEVVLVGRYLMVLPLVHEVVGVLWILIDELAVDEVRLGDVVIGGLVLAELRLDEEAVAVAVPRHISLFVAL